MLQAQKSSNSQSQAYQAAAAEIIRGIGLVSGLSAQNAEPGWIAVECEDRSKAHWLSEQIVAENVESYADGHYFYVPVGEQFTVKGEIKNVVTVVAKTTHYWNEHTDPTFRKTVLWEMRLKKLYSRLSEFFRK